MTNAPLVVLATAADVAPAARRLREAGHAVQDGFSLPAEPFDVEPERILCAGVIAGASAAEAALLAAVRGAGLLVAIDTSLARRPSEAFVRDLAKVGPLRLEAPPAPRAPTAALTADQHQLLTALVAGASVPDAARTLFISLRTAERRLAEARRALGVRTTAEAVMAIAAGG